MGLDRFNQPADINNLATDDNTANNNTDYTIVTSKSLDDINAYLDNEFTATLPTEFDAADVSTGHYSEASDITNQIISTPVFNLQYNFDINATNTNNTQLDRFNQPDDINNSATDDNTANNDTDYTIVASKSLDDINAYLDNEFATTVTTEFGAADINTGQYSEASNITNQIISTPVFNLQYNYQCNPSVVNVSQTYNICGQTVSIPVFNLQYNFDVNATNTNNTQLENELNKVPQKRKKYRKLKNHPANPDNLESNVLVFDDNGKALTQDQINQMTSVVYKDGKFKSACVVDPSIDCCCDMHRDKQRKVITQERWQHKSVWVYPTPVNNAVKYVEVDFYPFIHAKNNNSAVIKYDNKTIPIIRYTTYAGKYTNDGQLKDINNGRKRKSTNAKVSQHPANPYNLDSTALVFLDNGVPLTKEEQNRVQKDNNKEYRGTLTVDETRECCPLHKNKDKVVVTQQYWQVEGAWVYPEPVGYDLKYVEKEFYPFIHARSNADAYIKLDNNIEVPIKRRGALRKKETQMNKRQKEDTDIYQTDMSSPDEIKEMILKIRTDLKKGIFKNFNRENEIWDYFKGYGTNNDAIISLGDLILNLDAVLISRKINVICFFVEDNERFINIIKAMSDTSNDEGIADIIYKLIKACKSSYPSKNVDNIFTILISSTSKEIMTKALEIVLKKDLKDLILTYLNKKLDSIRIQSQPEVENLSSANSVNVASEQDNINTNLDTIQSIPDQVFYEVDSYQSNENDQLYQNMFSYEPEHYGRLFTPENSQNTISNKGNNDLPISAEQPIANSPPMLNLFSPRLTPDEQDRLESQWISNNTIFF